MKNATRFVIALGLAALIGVAFGAQDAKKEKKGGKGADPTAAIKKNLESVELTSEQKEKLEKIYAEHGPKLKAAADKVNASLTEEQRKARGEAQKAAKAAGKKGKEAQEEALAAMKLTDEQKKAYDDASKGQQEAQAALRKAVSEVLTAEQKEKAGLGKKKKNQ
jgi:hypothetical protein